MGVYPAFLCQEQFLQHGWLKTNSVLTTKPAGAVAGTQAVVKWWPEALLLFPMACQVSNSLDQCPIFNLETSRPPQTPLIPCWSNRSVTCAAHMALWTTFRSSSPTFKQEPLPQISEPLVQKTDPFSKSGPWGGGGPKCLHLRRASGSEDLGAEKSWSLSKYHSLREFSLYIDFLLSFPINQAFQLLYPLLFLSS